MKADDVKYINERFDKFEEKFDGKLDRITEKIDTLLRFKWQIIGGSVAASFILTIFLRMVMK